jgi:hypothetical protein
VNCNRGVTTKIRSPYGEDAATRDRVARAQFKSIYTSIADISCNICCGTG